MRGGDLDRNGSDDISAASFSGTWNNDITAQ